MDKIDEKLIKLVKSCKSLDKLFDIPFELFYKNTKNIAIEYKSPIKILILTATCNGFGDIVMAMKLKKIIKKWYGELVDIKIASNGVKGFYTLGEPKENLIYLKTRAQKSECRRFNTMSPFSGENFITDGSLVPVDIENFDLYFVAPLTADFEPDFEEIHTLVKNSNPFNTFFFTEYNMAINPYIKFNIGVGKGRLGLLIEDRPTGNLEPLEMLKNPYSIIYIANNDSFGNLDKCWFEFLQMLTHIYKLPILEVVAPSWMKEKFIEAFEEEIEGLSKFYSKLTYKNVDDKVESFDIPSATGNGELIIRFDVLPQQFENMKRLFEYSLPHVLLTGDQSFTDFVSLRYDDGIPFYQALPWKQNLYTSLAKVIPNKYYKSFKTSCGNLTAIRYNPSFKKLAKNENFQIKAKPVMDAVLLSVAYNSKLLRFFKHIVLHSRYLKTVKQKFNEAIQSY